MSAFICPHVSQDLRQHWLPSSPRHGFDVEQISLRAACSPLGLKLFKPACSTDGHDPGNGSAPVGHFNDLPRCNATQDRAGVLTKVSDSDPLHVAHCSTLPKCRSRDCHRRCLGWRVLPAVSRRVSVVVLPVLRSAPWASTGSEFLYYRPRTRPSGWLRRSPRPRPRPSPLLSAEVRPGCRVAPQVP